MELVVDGGEERREEVPGRPHHLTQDPRKKPKVGF